MYVCMYIDIDIDIDIHSLKITKKKRVILLKAWFKVTISIIDIIDSGSLKVHQS